MKHLLRYLRIFILEEVKQMSIGIFFFLFSFFIAFFLTKKIKEKDFMGFIIYIHYIRYRARHSYLLTIMFE
jgi:hypothetical protein